MQGGTAGLRRAVHALRVMPYASVGLLGMGTNLRVMPYYRHLMMCGRRFHHLIKPQRPRLPKRNSSIHQRLKSQQQLKNQDLPNDAGRWNLLVLLVGRGRHVQALEELVEFAQVLLRLVTRQFEVQTGERIRRGLQVYSAYSRLWGEEAARGLFNSLRRMLVARGRHLLLSAVCFSQYDWEANKIADDFMKSAIQDLDSVEDLCKATIQCEQCGKRQVIDQQMSNIDYCICSGTLGYTDTSRVYDAWEPFIERDHHIVWRKNHDVHEHLYAYKVYGTYDDVSLSAFMEVQLNSDFRTEWDDTALQLRVLDSHKESNSDLIYWLVKYPSFFANRDYIYKRRFIWNEEKQEAVIMNEAINPDHIPEEKGIHRVHEYWSTMVIRSKDDANKPGLHYTLTYFDNPGTSLPQWLTNFVAVTGFPSFLEKVHEAAVSLQAIHEKGKDVYVSLPKELRYPTTPRLETPTLEEPTDFDISGREDRRPAIIEETHGMPVTRGLTKVTLPELENNKNLESRVIELNVSGLRLSNDLQDIPTEKVDIDMSAELSKISEESIDVEVPREDEDQKSHISPALEEGGTSVEETLCSPEQFGSTEDEIKSLEERESRFAIPTPDIIEATDEMGRELSDEITSNVKPCDVEDVIISDTGKSLRVQRGTKRVEVGILEGMEVVAPDLDEKTTLSKNVEQLTIKAVEEFESRTVLVDRLHRLRNRLRLFQKHASQRKESSIKKMHELEERGRYDTFDDQTRKHLEKLFEAMREVIEADKGMRTGKSLMHNTPEREGGEVYTESIPKDKSSCHSTSLADGKKLDEKGGTNSKTKAKPSDDPPPPPPQPPASAGFIDTSSESVNSEKTTSNEIETYSVVSGKENDIPRSIWKSWMHIPYLTGWWESEGKLLVVENRNIESEVIQCNNSSEEIVKLGNDQNTWTNVISRVWYVVGFGWVFQVKSDESLEEESAVSRHPTYSSTDENYNWYWYPIDGVYRLYSWAFKSSKESA